MQFQTNISFAPQQHNQIDYNSKLLLLGSCFTENIGKKLTHFKFQNTINPFGILFHPKAIENLILNSVNKKEYADEDIFFHNERWHSFEAHSVLSASSKEELLTALNNSIKITNQQLKDSTHIIITLGTAWVYRFIEMDIIVANCHKILQKKFLKELLSVTEIAESLVSIVALIKSVNKKASVIFTVSPVRHLKDGFIENTQSKAHLISGVHQAVEPRKSIHYFPSYELLMDELRDYRFYAEDMLHPNKIAINYIWEKFSTVWISESAQFTMGEIETIQKGLSHKPFNPNSDEHQEFLQHLEEKINVITSKYENIEFSR